MFNSKTVFKYSIELLRVTTLLFLGAMGAGLPQRLGLIGVETPIVTAVGNNAGVLGVAFKGSVDFGTTTWFIPVVGDSSSTTGFQTTETNSQIPIPIGCTAQKLFVRTIGAQGTGAQTYTFRRNGANTSLVVTVSGGAAAGNYSDTVDTVALTAGDLIDVQITGAALAASATQSIVLVCQ